jgi:hypothetical protein
VVSARLNEGILACVNPFQAMVTLMTRRRVVTAVILLALAGIGWYGYMFVRTWREVPYAYAAWDAGTLLVEYLETHDNHWPRSWDELRAAETTLDSHGRRLRGSNGKGGFIYGDLKDAVAIDWNADVEAIASWDWDEATLRVVTRSDGRDFYFVWENPNTMVWKYLRAHGKGRSPTNPVSTDSRPLAERERDDWLPSEGESK